MGTPIWRPPYWSSHTDSSMCGPIWRPLMGAPIWRPQHGSFHMEASIGEFPPRGLHIGTPTWRPRCGSSHFEGSTWPPIGAVSQPVLVQMLLLPLPVCGSTRCMGDRLHGHPGHADKRKNLALARASFPLMSSTTIPPFLVMHPAGKQNTI